MNPPSAALTTVHEMPAMVPASLETPEPPRLVQAHPVPGLNEVRGTGGMRVSIVSRSPIPAFVKIRDSAGKVVAQVHVSPERPGEVNLDGGHYQMFVRVMLDGEEQYFKAPAFELPPGARGSAVLSFEVRVVPGAGGGQLQTIPKEQF